MHVGKRFTAIEKRTGGFVPIGASVISTYGLNIK